MIAGRYALGREVGRGGMGAVWLGTDEVLGRQVALKRLGRLHDRTLASRAEREARLAARLSHPHVVAVYDLVADGGDQWLVMEYVAGSTLAARIDERGALSPDELAPILRQVADALAAAHAAGVVHRDVKPSNILLDENGAAKLTDFGIARGSGLDATLTQTGFLTGSPAYLAPEVAAGQPSGPASDVWALGASAFHALAGRPPYEIGDNVVGTLYRIVHEQPPRTDRAGRLAPLVAGMMTRDPQQRWSLEQARTFLAGPPAAPSAGTTRVLPPAAVAAPGPAPVGAPVGAPAPRRWPWVVGILGAAAIVGLVLALTLGSGGDDPTSAGARTSTGPAGRTTSPSATPSGTGGPSADAGQGPTADGVRAFVSTYLQTASSDPAKGFAMLTPDYQRRSGGLAGYERFWGRVRKIHQIQDVAPSLAPLGVSYRYTYTLAGAGKRTEDVQLRLVYDDGRYLIAAS